MTPASAVAASVAVAVALAAAPAPARAEERVERFTGTARGAEGEVLYVEEHAVRRAGERLLDATTTYRDDFGRIIAVLRTDFARDPFAPSYAFEDLRTGAVEAVAASPGGIELRAGRRSRVLPLGEATHPLVTGQGLDRLVREKLEALAAGETLFLRYAIPSRLAAYDMRVRGVRRSGETVRVRVEFTEWILRMLAPSLEVEYDRATRRLLRYRGISNLEDERGQSFSVEITYAYPRQGGAHPEVPDAAP